MYEDTHEIKTFPKKIWRRGNTQMFCQEKVLKGGGHVNFGRELIQVWFRQI